MEIVVREELEQLLLQDADVDLKRVEGVPDFVGNSRGQGLDQARLVRRLDAHPRAIL